MVRHLYLLYLHSLPWRPSVSWPQIPPTCLGLSSTWSHSSLPLECLTGSSDSTCFTYNYPHLCTRQLLPAVEAQNLQVFLDSSLSSPRSSYQHLPESLFISTPYSRTPPRLTTSHVSILIQDTICLHLDSCNGHLTRLSASGPAHLETLLNTAARAILFKKKKKKVQSCHSSVQNLPKTFCFYSVKPKFPTQSPRSPHLSDFWLLPLQLYFSLCCP